MENNCNAVMSSLKGSKNVNVIPTKENVDFDLIYKYNINPHFGAFKANRELKNAHVKEIQSTIENGKYKAQYIAPIRVDIGTMKITDGQHRNTAFCNAWENGSNEYMKVIFEDLPQDEREKLDIIVDINSTTDNWGITAFEHKLKEEGNKSMLNIESFGLSHKLCQKTNKKGETTGYYPRYVYAVLFGKNVTKDVKNGTISIAKKELEFGEKMYHEIEMLVDALGYEVNAWFESFAHAWFNIRKNDNANSSIVDEIGIETICKHIFKFFNGWHPVTRKTDWENRFRAAIWEIKRGIESKTIN